MKKVTQAIVDFLSAQKQEHPGGDLLDRYLEHGTNLETQVNVMAGPNGEPVAGKRATWTDGINQWWNIRIPKRADSAPVFRDYRLRWPLEEHAEGIGATGWDWVNRVSRWVGFDFDALVGHAAGIGLSGEELRQIRKHCEKIPWVEVRKSTGGKGIHLYVMLAAIPTENHTEHAALARCVLEKMSTLAGYDFSRSIDCCGSVMWIWHRKLAGSTEGLKLVKAAEGALGLENLPSNWRDHSAVVSRRQAKISVEGLDERETAEFEMLASARPTVELDAEHKQVIEDLTATGFSTVWLQDYRLLQTHTAALKQVHKERNLKGIFGTNTQGQDRATPNCFMFPLPKGGWKIYRFGKGVVEIPSWDQDGQGWTSCYFNQNVTIKTACLHYEGVKTGRGYQFDRLDAGLKALQATGVDIKVASKFLDRPCEILTNSKGISLIKFERIPPQKTKIQNADGKFIGSEDTKGDPSPGKRWVRGRSNMWECYLGEQDLDCSDSEILLEEIDTKIRSTVALDGSGGDWYLCNKSGQWNKRTKGDCYDVWQGDAASKKQAVGRCLDNPWKIVVLPFQPEYPGDRQWNRNSPQYIYEPKEGKHLYWDLVLDHCFCDLNESIKELPWAIETNIRTGAQYGLTWLASCFRRPYTPLPYLFFFGSQENGKSMFHEAIRRIITHGVVNASNALSTKNDFNGELVNAVIAYVEEVDMNRNKLAYNRVKDWTTSEKVHIRRMRTDGYEIPNTLHFIQTANSQSYCPVFAGDTRITVIEVPDLLPEQIIPKDVLKAELDKEGPAFTHTLLNVELPKMQKRLGLPVVDTSKKKASMAMNRSSLEVFLLECCIDVEGSPLDFSEFYSAFYQWCISNKYLVVPQQKVLQALPSRHACIEMHDGVKLIQNLQLKETSHD